MSRFIYNHFLFCTSCGNALMVRPQKNPKDTNICKKAAKESSIDYRLLSVNKDQFTPFLSKRLEQEILSQGERHSLCLLTAGNSKETKGNSISSTFYFQTEPYFLRLAQELHYPRFWALAADFKEGPAVSEDHPTSPPCCTSYWKCTEVNLMPSSLHQSLWYPLFGPFIFVS